MNIINNEGMRNNKESNKVTELNDGENQNLIFRRKTKKNFAIKPSVDFSINDPESFKKRRLIQEHKRDERIENTGYKKSKKRSILIIFLDSIEECLSDLL